MLKKLLSMIVQKEIRKISYPEQSSSDEIKLKEQPIHINLDKNIQTFSAIFSIPENVDAKIRNVEINGIQKKAALLYISSISDTKIIEDNVIKPFQKNVDSSKKIRDLISAEYFTTEHKIKDVLEGVTKGNTALFVEGENIAYMINAANFQGRNIEKPENEVSLKGPKEAFNEKAMTNISLIRKKIKSENLVVESFVIAKRSKNEVFIAYIKDIANDDLLKRVKEKVNALDVDSVQNISELETLIEERKLSLFPTILHTERPDRVAHFLEEGYVVLLMENSPSSLVMPATFWSFYHTADDRYFRFLFANFTRALRIAALFITLFTSAIYVSVTNFHAEMVPPDLLLAIASTREKVPFPAFIEVIMMEIAFELIREAGLRVPSPIGPTIGIVGALILGQAAVSANIVSPIVVIVVALGGLSSFAIGDLSLNYTIRLSRFLFILSAGMFGFYGMTALFMIGLYYIVSLKSFGVPYLAPYTPKYISSNDTIFRRLSKNEFFRPGYLKPKDIQKKSGD
ncbi:spore germination protein [Bacillus sp. CGMCC 1.16607]|uniref:spore germination protein n=1 Tax=Bacillus sp. CGMCC 1.16607 TaxID=3351842 RepID=UPI003641637E